MTDAPTNESGERLEIHERCLRDTKNDQLWEAHAEYQGRVGPTIESHSRKSVRAEARAAFEERRRLGFWEMYAHFRRRHRSLRRSLYLAWKFWRKGATTS